MIQHLYDVNGEQNVVLSSHTSILVFFCPSPNKYSLLPWYNWNVVPIATNLKKKIQINLDIIFQEIKQFLTDRLAEVDNDKDVHHDSLIVMMMSGKIGCTSAEIYDKDGNILPMNEILQILKDSQYFKGKPKIVIIQTYNFQGR